jgi:hypothetical protein
MPRISDLANVNASCRGKIELMLADDDQAEEKLITALLGEAVKGVAANYVEVEDLESVVQQFQGGKTNIEIGDDIMAKDMVAGADKIKGLTRAAKSVCSKAALAADEPAALASAIEFILESLYVNSRLSKYSYHGSTFYKR